MSQTISQTDQNLVDLAGQRYMLGKMDCFKQLHVLRKLAPLLTKAGDLIFSSGELLSNVQDNRGLIALLSPAIEALSTMPEEDVNYVLYECMAVAKRFQMNAWVPVFNTNAKTMQFNDIDLSTLVQLSMLTLRNNLFSFTPAAGSNIESPNSLPGGLSPSSDLPRARIF